MKKILIMEDDADTLDIIGITLEENGYEVRQSRKKLSLGRIIELLPNLILLDDRDHGDMCLALKRNSLTKHIPIILLSTNPDIEHIATTCKADGFVSKPFDINRLEGKVKEMLR